MSYSAIASVVLADAACSLARTCSQTPDQHLISQPVLDHVHSHFHRVDGDVEVNGNLLGDRLVRSPTSGPRNMGAGNRCCMACSRSTAADRAQTSEMLARVVLMLAR